MRHGSGRLAYRPELDGLRAVAVLLVLVHHVWQPHRFAGFVGVDVFFVLSGFLITTILLDEREATGTISFRLFYARRMLRLYPALVAMLAVSTLGYSWLSGTLLHHVRNALFAGTYTSNVFMTYGHAWVGPFGHTWSLALEEQYYLIWPPVLLFVLRRRVRRRTLAFGLVAAALGSAALYVHQYSYGGVVFSPFATAFGLLLGSALALLLVSESSGPRLHALLSTPAATAGGVALLVAVLLGFSLTTALPDGWYAPLAAVATLLVIGACVTVEAPTALRRTLSLRPAVHVGRISYAVYLWHYPVVMSVREVGPHWSPWWVLCAVLPVTLVLAQASGVYVEAPFLRLKARLHPPATPARQQAADTAGERPPARPAPVARPSEADA